MLHCYQLVARASSGLFLRDEERRTYYLFVKAFNADDAVATEKLKARIARFVLVNFSIAEDVEVSPFNPSAYTNQTLRRLGESDSLLAASVVDGELISVKQSYLSKFVPRWVPGASVQFKLIFD